ncbi:MAG: hypothetical protein ABSF29_16550 [Tepidisphaeraceae bacterium]
MGKRANKIGTVIYIGALAWFFGRIVWHEVAYSSATAASLSRLEGESALISAPAQDVLVSQESRHGSGQVLVDRLYQSSLNYSQLRAYYDAALATQGWRFDKDEHLKNWGSDLGGMDAHYRKGNDAVSLQFAGAKAQYGWTYALSFTWDSD